MIKGGKPSAIPVVTADILRKAYDAMYHDFGAFSMFTIPAFKQESSSYYERGNDTA